MFGRITLAGIVALTLPLLMLQAQPPALVESGSVGTGTQQISLQFRMLITGDFLPGGGLRVVTVNQSGPGAHMTRSIQGTTVRGILERGDVIAAVNGRAVRSPHDYFTALNATGMNGMATLTVRDVNTGQHVDWEVRPAQVQVIGPPPLPPPARRATAVKVLLVADTDDAKIGRMIAVSSPEIQERFKQITGFQSRDLIVLDGPNATAAKVLQAIDNLNIAATETVVYYHIGHGAYDGNRAAGDPSGGHFFALPRGDLMRKQVSDRLRAKGAQLTALISDTCNIAAPASPVYTHTVQDAGENWVMNNLFRDHRGYIDISGSSRNEYGWFSTDIGGWFSNAVEAQLGPRAYPPGTNFVRWSDFIHRTSDATNQEYKARRVRYLMDPGLDAVVRGQLSGQADQRPQVFVNDVQRIQ